MIRALFLAVLCAQLLPLADGQEDSVKLPYEKFTLSNGLQVMLHVDRKLPVVHVNQWFHVGSSSERLGRTGFAHLFEHMMFEGSKNAPGKYFSYLEKAGANLFEGGVNGTTDWDRTNYFATVPAASLETLLWTESDRLATLTDVLTKEKLDNERDIVKNERRQGLENQPYGRWIKLLFENLYPYRHPYANDVIGSHEDLTAASTDDVKEFFKTYYTPNNLSMVIAGDFDPAEARRLVEKYFGGIPPGPALERPVRWIPRFDGERVLEVRDRVPQERTYFAWHTPAFFEPGDAEFDLLGLVLTDGLAARLNKALVYDTQLCSDVASFQMSRELGSNFVVFATARPGAALPRIEQMVGAEMARLAKEGPSAAELKRAKAKWEYGFISGLERIGGFGGKADLLNVYNTYLRNADSFDADLARHRGITVEGMRDAVAKWLNTPNRLVIRFHPETSGRETQVTLDRSKQPALGADRPFKTPEVKTARLDNGMDVFVVERRDLPKVAVTFSTRVGTVYDPAGKEGLSNLLIDVIRMGTRTRGSLEIENALGDLGTSIGGSAQRERADLGMEVLKRNLAPALAIFADVVRNPVFPEAEVDREKKRRLDGLSQEAEDPNAIASRLMGMLAFGRTHAYGRPAHGLPSTVAKITPADFESYYKSYWKPGSTALIFAGAINLAEAVDLAKQNFGTWSGGAVPAVEIPEPAPMGNGKVYVVDRHDAAQTMVAQVLAAPRRTSPDYYAVQLADAVWGGTASSRLNYNLREQKGYSYGIFSFPLFYSKSGIWPAMGGVQSDKTRESLVEFSKEVAMFAGEKPVTQAELDGARANRVRGYAQRFESLSRIGGAIAHLWAMNLPMSELQRETDELGKTSLADVNRVAQQYARPNNTALLLVGDRTRIEPAVRELKLGEIVFLDVEGNPAPGK
jgi:zinc protease